MSTDIQTGNLPVNISSSSNRNSKLSGQGQNPAPASTGQVKPSDTVSITDGVSRLQEIEVQLAAIPAVNSAKVDAIKQAIDDGSFKIDPGSIANKLIDMESEILDSGKVSN